MNFVLNFLVIICIGLANCSIVSKEELLLPCFDYAWDPCEYPSSYPRHYRPYCRPKICKKTDKPPTPTKPTYAPDTSSTSAAPVTSTYPTTSETPEPTYPVTTSTTSPSPSTAAPTYIPKPTTSEGSIIVPDPYPSSGALTAAERNIVLKTHNDFRSLLAKGGALNKDGTKMPEAANMVQLKYNATLEKNAQEWAKKCSSGHSEEAKNGVFGENLFWTNNMTMGKSEVIVEACQSWWNELEEFGIEETNFTLANSKKGIGHFTQMAWAETCQVGCTMYNCTQSLFVVCRYTPPGNMLGAPVYTPGSPCSACPNGTTPADGYGNNGLCRQK